VDECARPLCRAARISDRPHKVLPFKGTLLEQGQQQAGELAAKVTTDGQRVDGELSVTAQGQSWAAKVWARVTGQRQAKPDVSAGIDFTKRWLK
jgi:hypothetical protein